VARLQPLPSPEWLDFTLPESCICLLTDDGSGTTPQLAEALTAQGWRVVVLSWPQTVLTQRSVLPEGVQRVELTDLSEAHLQDQLTTIATNYGAIAGLIHLHPRSVLSQTQGIVFLETDKLILRQVFLLAKYLKQPLTEAACQSRRCFLTVACLDGAFGCSHQMNFSAISAGLFGLTKSLNQEWPTVFCRAIDLAPDLVTEQAVQSILAELHDPNLEITEVAYGDRGRATLRCDF
jgi:NAD(P)-dependent dehydrogenase (short-subunit alcohol dehydrogenase family)